LAEPGAGHRRLPPQDLPAEQGVLGGVLVHGADVLAGIASALTPSDFYDRRHGLIFEAMIALYEKGQPVDEITVTSRLRDLGHLEGVGGAVFLADLADIALAPAHVDHYAQMVRDKAQLRSFIAAAQQAMDQAHTQQADPELALEEAEKAIFAATQHRFSTAYSQLGPVLKSALAIIEQRFKKKGTVSGVPTGFKRLDEITYGLQPGDLIIVAGRPSMGKTAFALNMAANAALDHQVPVAIFSLEMSKEQLGLRLLSGEARISGSKLRSGFLSQTQDWPALTQAADRLFAAPVYIDDTPALSVLELRAKARRLKSEHNLGLILVDYLQLMRGRRESFDSREQEISDISRSLKALAKELSVPVVALSQLNRKVEERPGDKRPMLSDLRESGAIEQDADVIAFIYRKKVYKKKDDPEEADDNVAEIIIGKQRNGPTGTVRLAFLDDLTKFEDLAFDDAQD
jgi:replicative DNA helicase